MGKSKKTLKIKVERVIPAPPANVFANWLNPKTPGNPWYEGDKLLFTPKVNGFFYWFISDTAHYGRFTKIKRPGQVQHTWVSPSTAGQESTVTVTFKKKGKDTLLSLVHSDLPNTEDGRGHEGGWNYFLDLLENILKKNKEVKNRFVFVKTSRC